MYKPTNKITNKCEFYKEEEDISYHKNYRGKTTSLLTRNTYCMKKKKPVNIAYHCVKCEDYLNYEDLTRYMSSELHKVEDRISDYEEDRIFFFECLEEVLSDLDIDILDFYERMSNRGWYREI